jgi:N-acetylglutamate synthase-like GNAT family acetyltransferase
VWADGEAVGCAALIPMEGGVYELSKIAVAPKLRGIGEVYVNQKLQAPASPHVRGVNVCA